MTEGLGWKARLTERLEPILVRQDPRSGLSSYHDMPHAIFWYPPTLEPDVRAEIALLTTRLEQQGKQVTHISLAVCMDACLEREGFASASRIEAEKTVGVERTVETMHQIISEYQPLEDEVISRVPADAHPTTDIIFICDAAALYPVYRTSSLLERLRGRLSTPAVLFYPGSLEGAAGLRFMDVQEAEHNYRARIF